MTALTKSTQRLEIALDRMSKAKRGNILKRRWELQAARTAHIKAELREEKRK